MRANRFPSAPSLATGLTVVIGAVALSSCGGAGRAPSTHRLSRAPGPSSPRRPPVHNLGRLVALLPDLLGNPPALSHDDAALLQSETPPSSPLDLRHTARIGTATLRGRYWLSPGAAGQAGQPAICLYYTMRRTSGIGKACFDEKTVRAGKAVEILSPRDASGGFAVGDLLGFVANAPKKVQITDVNGRTLTVRTLKGVYEARVAASIAEIRYEVGGRTVRITTRS